VREEYFLELKIDNCSIVFAKSEGARVRITAWEEYSDRFSSMTKL